MTKLRSLYQSFSRSKLGLRSLSALLLAPMALWVVNFGGALYNSFIALASMIMLYEWYNMTKEASWSWKLMGLVYIVPPCYLLVWVRAMQSGEQLVLWLVLSVWITDIAAYFFGIIIGGPKLLPAISPKKTWSGFLGAVATVALCNYLCRELRPMSIATALIIPMIAQGGDLLESAVKRRFHCKDSGVLIPGHGGLLDRLDGLLSAVIWLWCNIT